MQEKVSLMCFSVLMEISAPRDNCFGGNSAEPRYPPNTVIPRDGNFDTHLKPMKDTYIPLVCTGAGNVVHHRCTCVSCTPCVWRVFAQNMTSRRKQLAALALKNMTS